MKVKMTLIATFAALLAFTTSSYAVQNGKLAREAGARNGTINLPSVGEAFVEEINLEVATRTDQGPGSEL